MNKPIRTVSIFCMFLFLALMANVTYVQFWKAEDYNTDPRNARVAEASFSRERGQILVGDEPVATSRPSDDRYKYLRVYPASGARMFAPITGYLQLGSQTGIERSQNAVLTGEDPQLFVTRLVDLLKGDQTQGGNVVLTLNAAAQKAAFEGLRDTLGPRGEGSVVAIQPKTGRVLAMASYPSYDPNELATHDFKSAASAYERLDKDPRDPLVNRAIQTRLFPGSTFKLVTAAAAIESGKYHGDDQVPAGATYQAPGTTRTIGNDGRSQCNPSKISFATALDWSCNTTFAHLAVEVGPEKMREQSEKFGFNSNYLLDLKGQAQSVYPTGVPLSEKDGGGTRELSDAETAQTGIGQFEVQSTPLQMAMVTAAIANQGTLMRPYLVEQVQTAGFDVLRTTEPDKLNDAVSPQTARELTDLLVSVVDNGTASPAAIPNVKVAGKTGTAQRTSTRCSAGGKPPYAWFVSYAPADNAEVAVAVMIEEAPDRACNEIAGGQLGGPIAKAVMEAVLKK
ncbi:peptidoglycan D,D-transpeptidase FtsI family protein [Pimelobacter simplex]|uniref:peptidoglycan D,D-transpeptidase FtsI family protein n=1 Tax=Nocardioides simplex TaxID=2045 RepID=UPI00214F80DC|nr:penicillin-binding protein 2 [Pimelobacter simplex]UUW90891.1 penicillin-binding protein 2 [Pimelobacter simplex]UUW94720.1 penicillin-binding protein 2 [Pimelobacter simplex]